jgi:hypothetical protein
VSRAGNGRLVASLVSYRRVKRTPRACCGTTVSGGRFLQNDYDGSSGHEQSVLEAAFIADANGAMRAVAFGNPLSRGVDSTEVVFLLLAPSPGLTFSAMLPRATS